ncbi:MAG TPA: hypothetical protein VGK67_35370 [Myxococcales bacterium]|jgi:hypothetical protein
MSEPNQPRRPALLVALLAALALAVLAGIALLHSPAADPGAASGADAGGARPAGGGVDLSRPASLAPSRIAKAGDAAGPAGAAATPGSRPDVILAGWGKGPGEVARNIPQEGNPEAPMSFAAGPGGSSYVLDQVNGRIVRFGPDGKPLDPIPVTQQAPQDLAVAKDGTTLVLDRLRDKTVAVLKDGKLVGDLPVEGKGIDEGGGVTGVFVDGDDVYVEREHGPLVRVGDTDGKADPERAEVPGRPSRDGKSYLMAGIIDAAAGREFVNAVDRETLERRFTRELRLGMPVLAIVLLDSDLSGTLYLGSLVAGDPTTGGGAFVRIACLSGADGVPTGSVDVPANAGAEETFREFAVLDGGGVVYAQRGESGVAYVRYDCH